MGVVASVIPPLASAVVGIWSALKGSPRRENDTHGAVRQQEGLNRQLQEECERIAREARENGERLRREFEQKAADERERRERERREEAERYERQMRQMREQLEAAAGAEREALQRAAEEDRRRHEQQLRALAEESEARLARQREEAARMLREQEAQARREQEESARLHAELRSKWLKGIQPEVWPTDEELKLARDRLVQPHGEYFHCAIAGLAGSGKSSLINAFRGLRNNSPGAAPTGVTETTLSITAYRDASPTLPRSRFVWYDIPGAGTLSIPGWQYFNSQGLFVFDLIIVVVDNRFSEQDLVILKHCERFKIPSFLVRSKANQQIDNTMTQDYGWEGSEDERDFDEVYQPAREKVVRNTKASIRENLRLGGLDPGKQVFIVSCDALASLVREEMRRLKRRNQLIDEANLLHNCLEAVRARRF